MFSAWLVGLAGIWMFITPFIGFTPIGNAWSDWITGVLVAVFGFALVSRTAWQGWAAGIVAIWVFIAGFIPALLAGAGLWWNDLIVGVVFAICGFSALGAARTTRTAAGPTTTAA